MHRARCSACRSSSRSWSSRSTLGPGDIVVLYTDGVTEAHHRNQPLFGEERLIDVIRRADGDVDRVADDILAAVTEYGPAEPRDDVAVVVGADRVMRLRVSYRGSAMSEWDVVFERSERDGRPVLRSDRRDRPRGRRPLRAGARNLGRTTASGTGSSTSPASGFIDSSGIRELLKAKRAAQAAGGDLMLLHPSALCRRVLEISGVWSDFTVLEASS